MNAARRDDVGRRLGLWLFAALVASCSSTCAYAGTQDLPAGTDVHRFDPIAAYPALAAIAGAGAVFDTLEAKYVREDGTQDLAAAYIPSYIKDTATYVFYTSSAQVRDPKVPVGVAPTTPFDRVEIAVSEPRWISVSQNGSRGTSQYKHLGLQVRRDGFAVKPAGTPPPTCSLAALWAIARTNGAPPAAVANVRYDSTGYGFKIEGTSVDLRFDRACKLAPLAR